MTLSNLQYPLIKLFLAREKDNRYMPIEEAATLDQRPFRSLLIRGWISWDSPHQGFYLTPDGRDAWHAFGHTSIDRHNAHAPLCRYFYESVVHLEQPRRIE